MVECHLPESAKSVGQCGTEEKGLPLPREGFKYSLQVLLKTRVQQPVCLIKNLAKEDTTVSGLAILTVSFPGSPAVRRGILQGGMGMRLMRPGLCCLWTSCMQVTRVHKL